MTSVKRSLFAVVVAVMVAAQPAAAEEPKKDTKSENKLIGTWKMVSAKFGGREAKLPEESTHLKHITPTHFMWATYDKEGHVFRTGGWG